MRDMRVTSDPNLDNFYHRIARVQTAHANGFAFEAPGVIGRSAYPRPKRSKLRHLRPLLWLVAAVIAIKAVILHHIGADVYAARVDGLLAGDGFDRVGGMLMQADPATIWLAGKIAAWLPWLL
jgi:hypothetical protein